MNNDHRTIVGERLTLAMQQAGISPAHLARSILSHQSQVSRWARGHQLPSTQALIRLHGALGVSVDWLLGIEPPTDGRAA